LNNFEKNYHPLRRIFFIIIFSTLALAMVMNSSCKKDIIGSEKTLKFTTDTIFFDTVFTTLGSATRRLTVYNEHNTIIRISSISLAGGSTSMFTLNIDGVPGNMASDVEIPAHDSIFIFARVTVDPRNSNNPLAVSDSILFETNGNLQTVKLVAWGQDAHYILADTYRSGLPPYKIVAHEGENITWSNDKPYVVFGYAVVDSTARLNIDQGARIYFASNSGLWIYKGANIKVNGTKDNPVNFSGIRLEQWYRDIPGQWDRILINEGSVDNEINYAIIRNAFIGIQTETMGKSMGNKLLLKNTIIENMKAYGLLSRFYKIEGGNLLIDNCGQMAIAITTGGNYDFRQCTIGNYWNYSTRNTPSVFLSNYYEDQANQVVYTGNLDKAYFGNCIIYGSLENEIDTSDKYGGTFSYQFDHCLLKTSQNTSNALRFLHCYKNLDPQFTDIDVFNYTIKQSSPAKDSGDAVISAPYPFDLNNKPRDGQPDLGAYEFVP